MNAEAINPESELAIVDALLAGSDQPVEIDASEDLSVPATPPHATVRAEDVSMEEDDVVDLLAPEKEAPSPVPQVEKKERKDRVTAFADRIAEERARNLLGSALEPIIAGMGEAPKKVSEKVYNVLCHVGDRGKLSAYSKIGLKALYDEPETLNAARLVELFKAAGYSDATARSQAHQQMTALPILGVCRKKDHILTCDATHPLWRLLLDKGLLGSAEAPSPTPEPICPEELLATADEAVQDQAELAAEEVAREGEDASDEDLLASE